MSENLDNYEQLYQEDKMNIKLNNRNKLYKKNNIKSRQVIISKYESIELQKISDKTRCLELLWDDRIVTTPREDVPSSLIYRHQDTLEAHSSVVNVISTEAVEGIEELGFSIRIRLLLITMLAKFLGCGVIIFWDHIFHKIW